MYNDKDCSGRKTKMNPGWTKQELINELKRLKIPYKSKMTKAELCHLLTSFVNEELIEPTIGQTEIRNDKQKEKAEIIESTENYSIESLETALGQKTLTTDAVINILKYLDPVDLVTLRPNAETMPHIYKITNNKKLWMAKKEVLEIQVGFKFDSYIGLNGERSDWIFILNLVDAIVAIRKMEELWLFNTGTDHSDYWMDIIENIFFKVAQSGMIGLVFALGYSKELLNDGDSDVSRFGYTYYRYYDPIYEGPVDDSIRNGIYKTDSWAENHDHMWFDHMLLLNIFKNHYIDDVTVVCAFSGYAREMVDFLIEHYPEDFSSYIYIDYMDKLSSLINDMPNGDFKDKLVHNFNYAYTKLDDKHIGLITQREEFKNLLKH